MRGDLRIPQRGPVPRPVAGAGTQHEGGALVGNEPLRVLERLRRQRDIPRRGPGLDAASPHEPEEGIEHVFPAGGGDPCVGEQPLQFARALPVETELDGGGHQRRHQAGADRKLQIEEHIEAAPGQIGPQPEELPRRCPLVEGDKLDAGKYRRHQLGFDLADDPRESGLRPRGSEGVQRRRRVARIADGRQAQQADILRRRIEAVRR